MGSEMRQLQLLAVTLVCASCAGHSTTRAEAPPLTTRVPSVLGLTEADALQRLAAAGLCPGATFVVYRAGVTERVVEQDPAVGARVAIGTPVRLSVLEPETAAIFSGSCPNPSAGETLSRP